ncbi:nestin isoform X2 [Prionailurus bengalensis]|uniref:nestin isoform X2 n=1 Tax=Prionailurus bengalensis TaxID=37029 RepID=UPI001CA9EEFA|nr:nestin isoform X2 [Prionailurus bengalensis]
MEGCLGEESFQMWELNRRLEAYVARVKALEEQNELLGAELGGLRAQTGDASWRARADDELAALRALVDRRWREKHAAEVARDNLAEEAEGVAARCQQQRRARERAAAEAARSRREAEAEKGARARLSSRAAELERELEAVCAAHEQERAALSARPRAPRRPAAPRGPPAPAPELHELARRLGEAWRGAVRGYQERVALMEASLGQARERLGRAVQGAREGRLELRQLRAERGGLRERRAALEHRLEGRWQERLRATEQFQLAVEALEQEKESLQSQIAQVLEGRQQLAHLKMSLSLEVATYRTLLEAENSRLQTPGSGSKASLSFQDPKLELHFSGTPEGRHLGPLLSALSPTPLSSPLPDTLETPVPGFLKSQEFLQARTPTLASTPIPPPLLAPCAVTDAEIKTQDAPLSLLQPQLGRQWAPEAIWAKAKEAIPTSVLPGPEEPGGEQQEASTGQSPEDHTSSAPPLNPDRPSLEAKGGEPNGSGMSSRFQEEGEGQIGGLAEKETAIEVKMVNGLQQETWQEDGGLNMKKIQDSQGHLEKETLKSLEEEIQGPLMSLEEQTHETLRSLEKENPESLRSSEEESLDTSKGLEKETQELLMSLEEKNADVVRPQEKETLELLKPVGNEDSQTLQSLEKENQELMRSLEGTLETFLYPEKESQELVRSREENFESMRDLEKENREALRTLEDGNRENLRLQERENQEFLNSPEDEKHKTLRTLEKENQEPLRSLEEDQDTGRPLEKENQEPVKSLEDENQETMRPLETENQRSLRSLEEEDQETMKPLEKENQEPVWSLEEDQATLRLLEKENQKPVGSLDKNQETLRPLEKEDQEPVGSLEDENQETLRPLEKENQRSLRSLEEEDQETMKPLETENQRFLRSLEEEDQETMKPLEKENQEPVWSLEEDQATLRLLEKENQKPVGSLDKNQETLRPLEIEDQEPVGSLEDENQETLRPLEKENQGSLEEDDGQETMRPLEKENQEPVKSLEDENQETMRPPEKENQRSLRSLGEEDQETLKPLEKESQEPVESSEEDQATPRLLEKVKLEPLKSLGKDQEIFRPLEKENQQLLRFLEEESAEVMGSPETENLESLQSAREDLGILQPLGTREPLWSPGEVNQETMKPLERGSQEPLESVEENQETLRLLEQENQESRRSPGEWGLENSRPPEGRGQESQRCLMEEETPEQTRNQESPGSLKEERQESPLSARRQGREERVADQELDQETPPSGAAGGKEAEAELDVREWGGLPGKSAGHGELQLAAAREVWSSGERRPGGPEPEEQRVPVEAARGEGGPEGFQDPEGQPEQAGGPGLRAPQGMSEGRDLVLEGGEEAPRGGQVSEVASTAVGEAASGSQQGPEREVVVPPVGEEGLEAEKRQGLEEPQKDPDEAAALKPELSSPAGRSTDLPEPPRGWEESEPEAPWGAEGAFPAETLCSALGGSGTPQPGPQGPEDAGEEAVLEPASLPKPSEPRSPTPIPGDAPGPQPLAVGSQEAGWGLEGRAEALGGVEGEPEELGSEGSPEDLQEEGEENREDSEADELGETLPDSTPLGLYLRSPASPKWDLLGEQRPPPQGETRKEGWDPSVLASEECGAQPGEEEEGEEEGEEGRREEECGQDSDLSEEFEDLEAEGSLLPGVPGEAVEPPGQRPQMVLEPAAWEGDGESDGFADEEESGEEGEEDKEEEEGREPGAGLWGPGPSVSTLRALSGPQRGTLPGSETVDVSVPWDDSSRGIAADAGEESQDSTEPEPSGSEEESDPAPLEREDPVPGPLESHCGMGDTGLGVGDTLGVNGRVPSLKEELEHVNGGVVNGLEQSEGGGQGEPGGPEGGQRSPLEDEEEGGALKTPWAGPSLHLGPGQFLKFGQREGDVESWSSGED